MATAFQSDAFQNSVFQVDAAVTKTGVGGIDPEEKYRRIVKPIGLLHLPQKRGRKDTADRIDESMQIAADVAAKLAREFTDESAQTAAERRAQAILDVSMSEADREIAVLLRKKLRTEEDEILILLLIAASVA